jgi:hypothetical protein
MSSSLRTPLKPSKSLYKGALSEVKGHEWTLKNETTFLRLIELLCLVLLPISVGLYGAAISSQDLVTSNGDGEAQAYGRLGYSRICFTGSNADGSLDPIDCVHVSSSCDFTYSQATQQLMQSTYGHVDSSLNACTEFNAYRAFHVMALILAGVNIFLVATGYIMPYPTPLLKRVRIAAFCVGFLAGICGVIAHCIFIDWWYSNQQNLVTLSYQAEVEGYGSTPTSSTLSQSFFELTGAWICALVSALFYVWTFTSATK